MPLLFKKSKASANSSSGRYPARSVEQLAHPALAPPDHNTSSIENYVDRHPSDPRLAYHEASGPNPQSQPPSEPGQSSLNRTKSQRQHQLQQLQPQPQQRDRTAVAPEDPQPRRRTGLFVRPASGILDRSPSISKGRQAAHPISQPASPRQLKSFADQQEIQQQRRAQNLYPDDQSPTGAPPAYEPRAASLAYQHQHLQHSQKSLHQSHPSIGSDIQDYSPSQQSGHSEIQPGLQLPRPPALERSNTDPTLVQRFSARPSPTDRTPDSPRYASDQLGDRGSTKSQSEHDLVLNNSRPPSRPPSRQTYEPRSPSRQQFHPDAMQQASALVPPGQQSNDRPSGQQDSSRRGSATQPQPQGQPQNMPSEPARSTPSGTRTREELENIDVRALIQKHDELRKFQLFFIRV